MVQRQFKIQGMDCAEEVATLKKVLGPLVGGEEFLAFDLLNARLTIQKDINSEIREAIVRAISKTGMTAIPWGEVGEILKPPFFKEHLRRILTSISAILTMAAFTSHAISHGGVTEAFQIGNGGETHIFPTVSIVLYLLAVVSGGWFIFPKALMSFRRMSPDMNLLMTIAVIGALSINEWLEAAMVTLLFSLSLLLESWSVERARRATKALLDLAPNNARILNPDGSESQVAANTVSIGTHFIVKPGERVPLDGTVVKGSSEINQAPITGESLPVEKSAGASVFTGTINGNGALEVRCEKTSEHSTLSNIIRLVSEAHAKRAPSEQWVERFAKIYTPSVMALAFLVLVVPPLFFFGTWNEWVYRALVLLVIACPCALVISTPVSIVAALAAAARNGVLVKGGKFIEVPARLKSIAFDKTGTITSGKPSVVKVVPFNHHSEKELLEIAAAIEVRGEHPIAQAITSFAHAQGVGITPADDYRAVQGKGATARIKGETYWLGSHRYLEEKREESREVHEQLESLARSGHTVVVVGNETHVCGFIALSDVVRADAKEVIERLRQMGIDHIVMLTGDNRGTADLISQRVGIDRVHSELLPSDKVRRIEELVQSVGSIAMVGDGVNDAPAMARSTLGIAMGVAGSDAAIESSDIALMSDDLKKIPWLIAHSKRTLKIIRQNITFSLSVKMIFVLFTFVGLSSLWGAIAADMGASLLVIFNGLRLLHFGPDNFESARPAVRCCG